MSLSVYRAGKQGWGRLTAGLSHNPPLNVVPPTWTSWVPRTPRVYATKDKEGLRDQAQLLWFENQSLSTSSKSQENDLRLFHWRPKESTSPPFLLWFWSCESQSPFPALKLKNKFYSYKYEHHKDTLWLMGRTSSYSYTEPWGLFHKSPPGHLRMAFGRQKKWKCSHSDLLLVLTPSKGLGDDPGPNLEGREERAYVM